MAAIGRELLGPGIRHLENGSRQVPPRQRPAYQAITAQYEVHSEAEIWTFYQVRADGISETTSQTLHFDGKEYPCGDLGFEEQPDTVLARKLGVRTVEVSYKKSGTVTRRVLRTVSADGKQTTLEVHITPEKGPRVEHRWVFER